MKKIRYSFILLILFSAALFAQDKTITVDDVIKRAYSELYPETLSGLQWIEGTDGFSWVDDEAEIPMLMKAGIEEGSDTELLSLDVLNENFEEDNNLKSFPRIKWREDGIFTFSKSGITYSYNIDGNELTEIYSTSDEAANVNKAPGINVIAYTKNDDLYIMNADGEETAVTTDGNEEGIVNGQSVHRNEFGISGGVFWSPKANMIAFYRMDESMVTEYPLVDINERPARLKNIRYPMAGMKSHHVKIGVYNIEAESTTWLNTGEPQEQYLTCVTWGPEENFLYVAHLNRDQNHMQLKKYDAATGDMVKVLFEEKNDKYVEPENDLIFLPGSSREFLWFSERDGYDHLYHYDTEGNLIKQVTKGEWVVLSFEGFDESGENLFVTSTFNAPTDRNFLKVNIATGDITNLTEGAGMHMVKGNSAMNYFIDTYTSLDVPRKQMLIDVDGNVIRTIFESDDPLAEFDLGEMKIEKIKSDEGVELYVRTIYPPDFDPSKKYPLMVYVYGGPHVQYVTDHYAAGRYDLWSHMMAQHGFVVMTLDNRGSANRGRDFEQAVHRQMGTLEVEDQLTGLDYLTSKGFIDTSRTGVFGWSYGGFMTISLMLKTEGAFKVGIAGGAVTDWKYYEVMYGERYMDTPESNPDGYKEASLLNHIDKLKGKLLLVHGTVDPVVVWQHTLALVDKAISLNIPLDYFPYTGHEHGVRGGDALHLYNKLTNYFLDNLK